ncbi:MAG TPA: dienelactone hydrolase family protein [Cyclobacteriaceae bacterium]|nr:dienelactone hydrolase family protein [Cyclobacteriaceae bacterium]
MKKIYLISFLLVSTLAGYSQGDITICHTPATEKFALFASSEDFNSEHQMPRAYVHVSQSGGKMITFDCPDGMKANAYVVTSNSKTNNWIFVFQEWWGLNDNIKKWADDLHKEVGNVNVIALDMYDGKLATDRENAGKYMQAFKQERGDAIVKGALNYVGGKAKVGTVGWCFGGGQSLQAALTAGKQTVACVMYYGMPEEDVSRLKNLNSDVLNIWATQDQWINKDVMDKFEKNMAEAGKKLTIESYDADHGFANPSNAIYNEKAYMDAKAKTIKYFKSKF